MLYFVPTPIGNLDDITVRGLKLLTTSPLIFCEDTRNTKKLINLLREKHEILPISEQKFISFHSHNEKEILQNLKKEDFLEKDVLYVSDAGMPAISDPGILLVKFAQENGVKYEVLPGANALLLALVSSGFEGNDFYFYGFLPHKQKERKVAYKELLELTCNSVFYESTHRILKSLEDLKTIEPDREIFVIKEATKRYETHFLGTAKEVYERLKSSNLNGEYAVVIKAKKREFKGENLNIEDILPLQIPTKQKAKLLSKTTGKSVNFWYEELNKTK